MKRIEVKLSLEAVAPLLDVIKAASDRLEKRLIVPLGDTIVDEDLKDVWQQDLLQAQVDELKVLLGLFDSHFFATGSVMFDSSNAEPVLRACSAVRLALREHPLKGLPDQALEAGEVALDGLPEPLQRPFLCYVFLATLQELIIQHLDSSILEG